MSRFQNVVDEILELFSLQAADVETMVQLGLQSLQNKSDVAEHVQELERVVNQREIEIEEKCLTTLALFQPLAGDMRTLSTILKANSDLERIADLALNLTERAEAMEELGALEVPAELADMVRYSLQMVKDADRALARRDVALARNVCVRDDQLDAMNRELIGTIADKMEQESDSVRAQLHVFSASRIIERIGDHATNIAEDVLYMVEGEIQRHQFKLPDTGVSFMTDDMPSSSDFQI